MQKSSFFAAVGLVLSACFALRALASDDRDKAATRDEDSKPLFISAEEAAESTDGDTHGQASGTPTVRTAAVSPAGPVDTAAVRDKTTLESVLRLASKNPMVEAANHRWLAATQKRPQMVALPDPRAEATYYVVRGMDKYMLGLSQEIPYPGKLILAGRIADNEAQAARLRYEAAVRDALSDAKESYLELYYIDRAQQVTAEIKKLYDRYAALAAGGKEEARPKLPETFRAESQRAQLEYDLVLLREMRAAEADRLRAVVGLSSREPLGLTEDLSEPAELGETLEHLEEIATAHNQKLAAAGVEVERAQYEVKQAHRAPIPDLMLGANYTQMGEQQRKMMGVDNPHGITAGFSIPLWVPKYRAMAKEAAENQKAAEAEQTAQRLKVRADLAKAYFSLSNSARLVKLYRETLLPQARQALQSAEELYRKGDANLASLLETTATVHNFELARLRATADFYQNVARLERTLGTAMQLKAVGKPETKP